MSFKETILDIVAEKVGNNWTIVINGVGYSPKEIARKYMVSHNTISRHLSLKTPEEFGEWLQNRTTLKELGLEGTNIILFRRDEEICWVRCVEETTGWSSSYVNVQLHRWAAKEIDTDELFDPAKKTIYKKRTKKGPVGTHMSMWGDLSNEKRDYNLDKLKRPSKWEQEQPEPDGFYSSTGGHTVASSNRVTYMKGD